MTLEPGSFSRVRALIAGDAMLDHYLWGEVVRISPEAPVPVVRLREKTCMLGGAANVAANLAGLGCSACLLGMRGEDEPGRLLSEMLVQSGIEDVLLRHAKPTTTKTRVMAQGQQLVRVDEEKTEPMPESCAQDLCRRFAALLPQAQVVILSDYGKGVLTGSLGQELIRLARECSVPVLVDPKGEDWERYRGATCITPNETELRAVVRGQVATEVDLLQHAARVRKEYNLEWLLVTRGAKGMFLLGSEPEPFQIPAKPREVFDVSGAGDTVVATLAAGVGSGLAWQRAAAIANVAAGVVVGKVGTQPIRLDELQAALRWDEVGLFHKICSLPEAQMQLDAWRTAGDRIVFTNGCFDLLHAGHIKLLHAAAREGSRLVIGLNSDASVRRLKGPDRPILTQEDRASILAALECVDLVIVFEEDTPLELIGALRPDVLVKGSDYRRETVVGYQLVESWGGEVVLVELAEGLSTTRMVQLIRRNGKR